jgi:IPT/TIG domain
MLYQLGKRPACTKVTGARPLKSSFSSCGNFNSECRGLCFTISRDALPYGFCLIQLSFAPTGSGTQTGSVLITSNDPATPQLTVALTGVGDAIYAVPSIVAISPPIVLINNGPVTLTITGANFYPQSVAQLNGVALATTFVSNSDLQAVIPASSLTAIGEQYLTVVNPLPGGGASASGTITPYQTLVIQPSALVSVPATGMVYAAIPASAPANPNTVIPINPATGAQGTPIAVGNGPAFLAASSDGSYLFVANQTDETVQRINLTTNAVEKTYPYTPNIYCSTCENEPATDLETVPGAPQEVLLAQGGWLSLYNDAGLVNYVPNDGICCYADPNFGSIALAGNPLTVYALPFVVEGTFFQTAALTSSGLQYTRTMGTNFGGNTTTGALAIPFPEYPACPRHLSPPVGRHLRSPFPVPASPLPRHSIGAQPPLLRSTRAQLNLQGR